MRAVDLNFAAAPFRNNTPYYMGYGLGALVVTIFTVYNVWAFVNYSRGNDELGAAYAANRAKLETLRKESADLQSKIEKFDLGSMNTRASFTNGLLERRRFSWTDLLNHLEEAQVYQVRLLSLLPRIQEKGIIIDARAVAHDLKAMWNFQQNLQIHPNFRRVYPGGWTKSNEQGEIVFNLAFNYFPQGAPEGAQGLTPQEAGMLDFVEAPGPNGGTEGEEGTDDLPAEEPPSPSPSKNPAKSAAKPAPGGAPPSGARAGAAPAAPAPGSANPRANASKDSIPGMTADPAGVRAVESAAPAGAPPAAGASMRPAMAGVPTTAPPTGASGASGATGATGQQARRVGRGLPPGSRGVRPPPPPETDVPTLPATPPPGGGAP